MKTSYIFLGVIAILIWNGILIKRDQELFKAYDSVCSELQQSHPKCKFSTGAEEIVEKPVEN